VSKCLSNLFINKKRVGRGWEEKKSVGGGDNFFQKKNEKKVEDKSEVYV